MVAGKVKLAMCLQKSPANPKPKQPKQPPPPPVLPSPTSNGKTPQKGAAFSRSFGVHFPSASAQVQPCPPPAVDVAELLLLVEDLHGCESLLKTHLLEHKLLRESAAIVPVLEKEISAKDHRIDRLERKTECLKAENERLRLDLETFHVKTLEESGGRRWR